MSFIHEPEPPVKKRSDVKVSFSLISARSGARDPGEDLPSELSASAAPSPFRRLHLLQRKLLIRRSQTKTGAPLSRREAV